jgi:hypothetical protein
VPEYQQGLRVVYAPSFDSQVEAISSPYWEQTGPSRVLGSTTWVFLGKTMAAGRAATS